MAKCANCGKKVSFFGPYSGEGNKEYCKECFDKITKKQKEEHFQKEKDKKIKKGNYNPIKERIKDLKKSKSSANIGAFIGLGLLVLAIFMGSVGGGFVIISLELILGIILLVSSGIKNSHLNEKIKDLDGTVVLTCSDGINYNIGSNSYVAS